MVGWSWLIAELPAAAGFVPFRLSGCVGCASALVVVVFVVGDGCVFGWLIFGILIFPGNCAEAVCQTTEAKSSSAQDTSEILLIFFLPPENVTNRDSDFVSHFDKTIREKYFGGEILQRVLRRLAASVVELADRRR
jgi:hypothetical protein